MENVLDGVKIMSIEIFLITPKNKKQKIPLPVVIGKEDDVFIAWCPLVNVATQGETIEEVVENMEEMLLDYYSDPDTVKPKITIKQDLSLKVGVKLERMIPTFEKSHEGIYAKIASSASQKSH